jgi:hypothetical protein
MSSPTAPLPPERSTLTTAVLADLLRLAANSLNALGEVSEVLGEVSEASLEDVAVALARLPDTRARSSWLSAYRALADAAPQPGCSCPEIQRSDPRRHFRGCDLRQPAPEGHPGKTMVYVEALATVADAPILAELWAMLATEPDAAALAEETRRAMDAAEAEYAEQHPDVPDLLVGPSAIASLVECDLGALAELKLEGVELEGEIIPVPIDDVRKDLVRSAIRLLHAAGECDLRSRAAVPANPDDGLWVRENLAHIGRILETLPHGDTVTVHLGFDDAGSRRAVDALRELGADLIVTTMGNPWRVHVRAELRVGDLRVEASHSRAPSPEEIALAEKEGTVVYGDLVRSVRHPGGGQ